jgi:hypothetical protein
MRRRTRSTGTKDLLAGPGFSARQVMTLVLAVLLAAVLVPVGARAAGSLVTLVDSTTTRQARVDTTNSLVVATRPANSTTWYYQIGSTAGNITLFRPPAGKTKLAISTLTFMNDSPSEQQSSLFLYANPDCSSNFLYYLEAVMIPVRDTVTISFPQPLLIGPGGSDWCLTVNLPVLGVAVTATGYYY